MEIFLVIWIMCGITSAVIASSKNRSFIGWLVLGFILGFFGLIMVCAMPRIAEESC
ncbi:hypothetical protein [Phyllobacterium brassicacearum]|nr:hypothetical protein [Phyllobacterium brassicacearum]TDQ34429.1 hypothetical protein DEV91_103161 [Phyllobacterium brassicacearum]